MAAPAEVIELIERFESNREAYRSGHYKEAQLRQEFVNPFFKGLGWDMDNALGYAEPYKEVIHEDAIKVERITKAPDYCFRVGGTRKFFVETKQPAVHIRDDASSAYQLKRYAWSAKLPLSILTDFEDFAVYDCRQKPSQADKASAGRTLLIHYGDYATRWDEIAGIFSRQAILKGSFDKYAESSKAKRGTAEVDEAFLEEIERWRDALAHNIALRNPSLRSRELNAAVQQTINRVVFLRISEARGIEPYGVLLALTNGPHIYERLCDLFRRADERYNSGLFHFREEKGVAEAADTWTLDLTVDDKPLKDIIRNIYYPESPYEFSVLPADILGQVYERFLGKVIRLTPGHQAKVEEKPEVKKAGGVYYTPTYIVDYIVKNTVGKLLEDKTPKQAAALRILDPACGSGSFLIGAYQYLLDWYRDAYVQDGPQKHKKQLYQGLNGEWRLTPTERKMILLDHIYGVDIDAQAVEVTKLSLLLKVLEGESGETLATQLQFFKERALPNLGSNIKCGNSLIGSDFYEANPTQGSLFGDAEERYRINAFDWEAGFPEVMHAGGFDAVIGNPPWVSLSGKFGSRLSSEAEARYLISRFAGNTYMPNMYEYFVACGLNLSRVGGLFSFVVPDRLGFNGQFVRLRARILSETEVLSLWFRVPFPKVTADTLVFVLRKGTPQCEHMVNVTEYGHGGAYRRQEEWAADPRRAFEYFANDMIGPVVSKLIRSDRVLPLRSICDTTSGFGGRSELIGTSRTTSTQIKTFKGDSISRYFIRNHYWFEFGPKNITGRTTDIRKLGASPKILLRKTGDRIIAALDDSGVYPEQSLYFLFNGQQGLDFKYLLGILNSQLLTFFLRAKALTNRASIPQVKKVDLDELPIRAIDVADAADQARHGQMVQLVERMLSLQRELAAAHTAHDKALLQRRIEATDRQIDRLVYELYGLTDEEIRIVEESART